MDKTVQKMTLRGLKEDYIVVCRRDERVRSCHAQFDKWVRVDKQEWYEEARREAGRENMGVIRRRAEGAKKVREIERCKFT